MRGVPPSHARALHFAQQIRTDYTAEKDGGKASHPAAPAPMLYVVEVRMKASIKMQPMAAGEYRTSSELTIRGPPLSGEVCA